MTIQINVKIEVEIHFPYTIYADCQTGGLAPRDTTAPENAGLKSWGLSFDSVVDSAYALYSCFHHVWYAFTSGSNEKVWGRMKKNVPGLLLFAITSNKI